MELGFLNISGSSPARQKESDDDSRPSESQTRPNDTHSHGAALTHEGMESYKRFQESGDEGDAALAIRNFQSAVTNAQEDKEALKAGYNLAHCILLVTASHGNSHTESISDDRSIDMLRTSLESDMEDAFQKATLLQGLGTSLHGRYRRLGGNISLEESITYLMAAVETMPDNMRGHTPWLTLRRVSGDVEDLLHKAKLLQSLGTALSCRYTRTEDKIYLEESNDCLLAALETKPVKVKSQAPWVKLSEIVERRKQRLARSISGINSAIEILQIAIDSASASAPDVPENMYKLGLAFRGRYLVTESVDDLNGAVKTFRDAADIPAQGNVDQLRCWIEYARAVWDRDARSRFLDELREAIIVGERLLRERFSINRDDCQFPEVKLTAQNFLTVFLLAQYKNSRSGDDLNSARRYAIDGLQQTPSDHWQYSGLLFDMTVISRFVYRRTGSMESLDGAIDITRMAIDRHLEDLGNVSSDLWRGNLAYCLSDRFLRTRSRSDLEEASTIIESLVESQRNCRAQKRVGLLVECSNLLRYRYHQDKDLNALAKALQVSEVALTLTPPKSLQRSLVLSLVCSNLSARYQALGSQDDFYRAQKISVEILREDTAPPSTRTLFGRKAVDNCILTKNWQDAAKYASETADLLPRIVPRYLSQADLQRIVGKLAGFAEKTAQVFLKAGKSPLESLQAFERCRGIISGLLLDLRSDLSSLREGVPRLYAEYCSLRDDANALLSSTIGGHEAAQSELAESYEHRHRLARDLEAKEEEIRKQAGFETFNLAPSERELCMLAHHGPIVSINVAPESIHAFLVTKHGVSVMELSGLKWEDIRKWAARPTGRNRSRRDAELDFPEEDDKIDEEMQLPSPDFEDRKMEWLWQVVVKPILDKLHLLWWGAPREELPYIWWITPGLMALLPLHAAGDHRHTCTNNTMSHVVSSYAPSIKSLQFNQTESSSQAKIEMAKVLVLSMPHTPGLSPIDIGPEVDAVKRLENASLEIDVLENPSLEQALEKLTTCSVAHFACHGHSHASDPSQSYLALGKDTMEMLTVDRLRSASSQFAQIAYLSACSTAELRVGSLVDESIHLASTFQLAGFRHVIGTLWGAEDYASGVVASSFLKTLFDNPNAPGAVPRALHKAISHFKGELNEDAGGQIWRWAPFIHFGPY